MTDNLGPLLVALDATRGRVLLFANGQAVAALVASGQDVKLEVFPEHAGLRQQLLAACRTQFVALKESLRHAVYEVAALKVNTESTAAMNSIPAETGRRVHMGCGGEVREGWLNIDYAPDRPGGYDVRRSFLNYDLRRGLPPLESASVDLMFSSHFFEHLRREEAVALLKSCRAALKPGGLIRFELPNFQKSFRAYASGDATFLDTAISTHRVFDREPPWARAYADLISRAVYEVDYSHKYIWDAENMGNLLRALGFNDVSEDVYRADIDSAHEIRREYSFYIQARA
ncbi:methyltransferase domain-containing protein [Phenylobacterium sp.]|uniref:class I SAM-dependent methyltransferase n=1 Tax=Phenylobacterium sp. TaxID=1871053 RepID=UPI0025E1BCCC|nr:methyltransferase domain-containing protein [Phenylobacterium sp.]